MENDITKMTPQQAYTKGFVDGASSCNGYPTVINIMGYGLNDLIAIVMDWQKRQPKELYKLDNNGSILRVEQWLEGHVVWVNGEIIFKSWEK